MQEARRGNEITRHITRIIDSKADLSEWHSTEVVDEGEHKLAIFLTSGYHMDKLIKKDKGKIDKMMNTLIKKDIPRDKKIKSCDKQMKRKK